MVVLQQAPVWMHITEAQVTAWPWKMPEEPAHEVAVTNVQEPLPKQHAPLVFTLVTV